MNTGANARLVVIDKPTRQEAFKAKVEAKRAEKEGGVLYSRTSVAAWPDDFPKAFSHTTVSRATGHPDHAAAKAGDFEAARRLVADLLKPERVAEIARRFPDAIVVPVVEQEKAGVNAIPYAIAEQLQKAGLKMDDQIHQVGAAKRSGLDAAQRLIARKEFSGDIKPGGKYLLVDDILTQGGTIHEMRHHIANGGADAVGVISLAFSVGSNVISIQPQTITQLAERFGRGKLEKILDDFNISGTIEALTESEGRAILRFQSLDALRNRLTEVSRSLGLSEHAGEVPKYSLREAFNPPPQEVRQELSEKLGRKAVARLEESGKLNIVRTMAGLPAAIQAGLGRLSAISRNIPPASDPDTLGTVIKTTTLAKLKSHPDYEAAKRGGDTAAAQRLVADLVPQKLIDDIKARLEPGKKAYFVPVIHKEGPHLNMIPLAFARLLEQKIGGELWDGASKESGKHNTGATQAERFGNIQTFAGSAPTDGQIVVVDDNHTSGDTFTALIDKLAADGNMPIVATTLSASRYQNWLATPKGKIEKLLDKAGVSAVEFEHEFGYPPSYLTGSEVQAYLLTGGKGLAGLKKLFPARKRVEGSAAQDGNGPDAKRRLDNPQEVKPLYSTDGKTIVGAYKDGKVCTNRRTAE